MFPSKSITSFNQIFEKISKRKFEWMLVSIVIIRLLVGWFIEISSRWRRFSSQKTIILLQKKRAQQDDGIKRAPVEPHMVKNIVENSMEMWYFCKFHVLMWGRWRQICVERGRDCGYVFRTLWEYPGKPKHMIMVMWVKCFIDLFRCDTSICA